MAASAVGPVKDTSVGDIVVINVDSEGPYGANLEADEDGCAAVIKGFEKLPNGKFGPLQKHGGVHYGDVLFAINDIQLEIVPFNEVMGILRDRNLLRKALKFMSSTEYYHRKRKKANSLNMFAQDKKANFLSIVRRARVTQEGSSKFVQYEIACQMRVVSMKLQKEIVYKWSVWKRYTEFEQLNTLLRQTYGWRMTGCDFPSSHLFVLNKLATDFIEMRREELNAFWQKIIKIDKATEFNKHHCSRELKEFLDIEGVMRSGGVKATAGGAGGGGGDSDFLEIPENSASAGGAGAARRASQKPTARRRSTNSTTLFTDSELPASQSVASAAPGKPRPVSMSSAPQPASSASAQTSAPANKPPPPPSAPPPPPPKQAAAAAAAPAAARPPAPAAAAAAPAAAGPAPPKASGARLNLLADIARRRIE